VQLAAEHTLVPIRRDHGVFHVGCPLGRWFVGEVGCPQFAWRHSLVLDFNLCKFFK